MNPYLTNVLGFGPKLMASLYRRIPGEARTAPTGPGRFSPNEALAHLADWEPIFHARMRQAVQAPGSTLEVWDEGERAAWNRYAEQDPAENLAAFASARLATSVFLGTLTEADWSKVAMHPEKGEMTVEAMANMLLGHDLYHLEQLDSVGQ